VSLGEVKWDWNHQLVSINPMVRWYSLSGQVSIISLYVSISLYETLSLYELLRDRLKIFTSKFAQIESDLNLIKFASRNEVTISYLSELLSDFEEFKNKS